MFLHELGSGESWAEMWTREVLPYLRSRQLVAGRGVRLDRMPSGPVIRAVPAASPGSVAAAAAPGYSGYFKLSLASAEENGTTTHTVTVADGATGGASTAVVNGGTTYSVSPYSEAVAGDRVFFLKYTPAQYDSGGQIVSGASLVVASAAGLTLPSGGTDGAFYMQLGRCLWNSGAPRVVQDHTAGVAEFKWYVSCSQYAT